MAEPITAIQTIAAPDLMQGSSAAAPGDAAAFASAVSQSAPTEHIAASAPASATGSLAAELARQANLFANHVQSASKGLDVAKPGVEQPSAATGRAEMRTVIDHSVTSMHGAYMFAIETTLASKGSTEATKIFNTLLKGQ